jgi:starch phosphorylase
MKFALNGACTIGTWDGANIEMAQAIGEEQFFVFGLRTEQVQALREQGYQPGRFIDASPALQSVLDAMADGTFSPGEPHRYHDLVRTLAERDPYLLMADFDAYVATQHEVDRAYADRDGWARRALLNIAGMGPFSVDRTIGEYVERVWAPPAP